MDNSTPVAMPATVRDHLTIAYCPSVPPKENRTMSSQLGSITLSAWVVCFTLHTPTQTSSMPPASVLNSVPTLESLTWLLSNGSSNTFEGPSIMVLFWAGRMMAWMWSDGQIPTGHRTWMTITQLRDSFSTSLAAPSSVAMVRFSLVHFQICQTLNRTKSLVQAISRTLNSSSVQ